MRNIIYAALACLVIAAVIAARTLWWRSRRIRIAVKEPHQLRPLIIFLLPDEFETYFQAMLGEALEKGHKLRLMRCVGPRIILRRIFARYHLGDDYEVVSDITITGPRALRNIAWKSIVKDRTSREYARLYVGF